MKKTLLILAVILLSGCSFKGGRSVDPAMAAKVRERVLTGDYRISVDVMTPAQGRSYTLTDRWDLHIEGEKVHSYLPYVGEAYMPLIGPGEGLDFDGDVKDYMVTDGKHGALEVEFWTMSADDRYDYFITVYPSGNAYMRVSPDRKSAVTFDGKLEL